MLKYPSLTHIPLQHLEQILDSIFYGFLVIDSKGIILTANYSARTIYEADSTLIKGMPLSDILPDEWVEVKRVLASGQAHHSLYANNDDEDTFIYRIPIVHSFETIGALCIIQDFSMHENILKKLSYFSALDTEYTTVLEQSNDAFIIIDSSGIVTRVNSVYEKMALVGSQALIGRHIDKLRRDPAKLLSSLKEVLQTQSKVTNQISDENTNFIRTSALPIFDKKGNLSNIIGIVHKSSFQKNDNFTPHQEIFNVKQDNAEIPPPLSLDETDHEIADICKEMGFIIQSKSMCMLVRQAIKVSQVNSAVLLQGESGVGKSMLASIIHSQSPRKDKPFVVINCGAIPEALMESELFGYEKGAFTGASQQGKIGLIESAQNGTVFFDEIGELKLQLQVKLLEVIELKSFVRVGGTKRISVDIRIIAATNRNLEEDIETGLFRKDLFYRLNVIPLNIPPLRERKEDVRAMTYDILRKSNVRLGQNKKIDSQVLHWLIQYSFPGNTRELVNIMEWMLVMSEGENITLKDLPLAIQPSLESLRKEEFYQENQIESNIARSDSFQQTRETLSPLEDDILELFDSKKFLPLKEASQKLEAIYIRKVIDSHNTLQDAAVTLNVHFSTLWRKMTQYGISAQEKNDV